MSDPRRCPERDALLSAVERVRDVVLSHAEEAEQRRTLAPEVISALLSSGLFALGVPRALGGAECDPLTQVEIFEAMTRLDTSAGWSLMIGALTSAMAGAYLPDRGVARIFEGPFPLLAGQQQPMGVARPVSGGYEVNGRWGFGSGVRHAQWILTCAVVASKEADQGNAPPGPPQIIQFAAPVSQVRIENTWDTAGLRGSGSEHYRIENVFVPDELTCTFPTAPPRRGGAFFNLPFLALVTPGHIGFALGAARRALDEITALAPRRVNLWTQASLGSHASFHMNLGRAEAKLAAARAYAFEVVGAMWDQALAGEPLSHEDWSSVRVVLTYVTEIAAEAVDFAYRSGGGSALYASSPLQRYFRDIHAATQHVAVSEDAYEFAGRVRLGTAELNPLLAPRMSITDRLGAGERRAE